MAPQVPAPDAVRRQLEKIVSSRAFAAAERSRALLNFLVEHTLDGHSERLKEYTLGSEALGRGERFDPRTDPIVRAEASRLRARLERYYAGEGTADPVLIAVPKGSYVPRCEARVVTPASAPAEMEQARGGPFQKVGWVALGVVAVAAFAAFHIPSSGVESEPSERVVALTALQGAVWWPTFSPDGRQVAFAWTGDERSSQGIYLTLVGAPELRRLVDAPLPATGDLAAGRPPEPSFDFAPAWSPDGLKIAFVRSAGFRSVHGRIHLVSALGGTSRQLSEFPAVSGPFGGLSWSSDARWLAAARGGSPGESAPEAWGIYLIPVDGGEPRLVAPARPGGRNLTPTFSPDGRRLAYSACATREASPCDVRVVDLDAGLVPTGSPRWATRQGLYSIMRIAWAPDGRWLVYDTEVGPDTFHLWRVRADGSADPERIELAGVDAWLPAMSDDRLAFTRWHFDSDIVRFGLGRPREVFPGSSSYWDGGAHFSPDGRRVAFESMRSGERQEIWLADIDGSNATQLTRGPGRMQGSPKWSPDGQRIVFDSQGADGHWGLFIIDVARGVPSKLTDHAGDENVPHWSRDGRWIYFTGRRGGTAGIWRIPAEGGTEETLVETNDAIGAVQDSMNGETLYFTTSPRSPLIARPLNGGPDRQVVDCVSGIKGFAVVGHSLYYADCAAVPTRLGPPSVQLHRLDVHSGENRVLGTLESYRGSLMVSPDERTILYTSVMRTGSDLMLIEHFGQRLASW